MLPQAELSALDIDELHHAKVVHIIETMHDHKSYYILVIKTDKETKKQHIVGLFATSQISKQLHKEITDSLGSVLSITELKKRDQQT